MPAARCQQLGLLLIALTLASHPAQGTPATEFFEKRVRPVLVEHCYECHGEKKQKGGLRLDSAAGVLKGGDSGPSLIAGHPESSKILLAVSWKDPNFQMPPKNQLSPAEIQALTEWVKMGAPDPRTTLPAHPATHPPRTAEHWAYQPLRPVPPPPVHQNAWPHRALDHFILAKLEARTINPSVDAAPATLLRRVHYDLIGLPPTPEQIEAWLKDPSADAWERVVDRLLSSPQFGERWGRHWLDVVRFGESVTLRGFVFQEAWRYRDYVVEAFNEDRPYDQFVREQLAGDLLPATDLAERRRQRIATTFLALGNTNLEEQDKSQLRMDVVDEQLDTIGKAFLAQTLGCARCHDHKFDPIPTRDYYAMAGILRNTTTITNANVSGWLELPLPLDPAEEAIHRTHEGHLADLQAKIKVAKDARKLAGSTSSPEATENPKPPNLEADRLPGIVVDSSRAKAVGEWQLSRFSGHFIGDGYLHDNADGKGAKTLTFIPDLKIAGMYEVRLAYQPGANRATQVPVTVFHADGETRVLVNQRVEPGIDGRFFSLGQYRFESNGFGYVLVANEGTTGHVTADAVQFLPADSIPVDTVRRLSDHAETSPDATLKSLEAELRRLQQTGPRRPLSMSVREAESIEDTAIHVRGSVHQLGAIVPRGFPGAMTAGPPPAVSATQSGRRELADWITSPVHPLTARVLVNRVWHWLFGAGLVRTTDNFGTMGESPSHPELLDHLAAQFMSHGWSVKRLLREILLSHTYRLAATGASAGDPENRLLARANRRRFDAECLRDTLLFVGGQWNSERGGPSFPPGLPADYGFQFTHPRRSVYVPVFRNALPDLFEVFDFADPSLVVGARNSSTVATQALFLMNHPMVREQARAAAQQVLARDMPDDEARLRYACRRTLGRDPTAGEASIAQACWRTGQDRMEAWTDIFHALFASPDFRYIE